MNYWDEFQIESKIMQILDTPPRNQSHHFERPFYTAYQIAIEFRRHFPDEFRNLGIPVGGKNSGRHDSLAQYIARELSHRIQRGDVTNIEGAFLHHQDLLKLEYADDEQVIESSMDKQYLSMYRRID